jgi:hypothetical protein
MYNTYPDAYGTAVIWHFLGKLTFFLSVTYSIIISFVLFSDKENEPLVYELTVDPTSSFLFRPVFLG